MLDSITVGYQSTDGNGYREHLIQDLPGDTIQMVGLYTSGNMPEPQMQGISGATIASIQQNIGPALAFQPNLVTLHAGTNDM